MNALSKINIALIFTAIIASGCATAAHKKTKRYFFPPLPNDPKVEWLARYTSQNDFPKSASQLFRESVVGKEDPKVFKRPWGIASDGQGKVYVADTHGGFVRIFNLNEGKVEELGGEDAAGLFDAPIDIDLDNDGNVYVSDSKKGKIFVFTKDGKPLRSLVSTDEDLKIPGGLGMDRKQSRLYVAYTRAHKIAVFDLATGLHVRTMGYRGEKDGEFNFPSDVAVDSKSNVIVADSMNGRVQIFDKDGNFIRAFGKLGDGATDFQLIKGVAVNKDDLIFLSDARLNRMMIFDEEGQSLLAFGSEDSVGQLIGGFNIPQGVYIDKDEKLYVVDALNKRFHIYKIIDADWLREHPIKEEEAAKPAEPREDGGKGKKK